MRVLALNFSSMIQKTGENARFLYDPNEQCLFRDYSQDFRVRVQQSQGDGNRLFASISYQLCNFDVNSFIAKELFNCAKLFIRNNRSLVKNAIITRIREEWNIRYGESPRVIVDKLYHGESPQRSYLCVVSRTVCQLTVSILCFVLKNYFPGWPKLRR